MLDFRNLTFSRATFGQRVHYLCHCIQTTQPHHRRMTSSRSFHKVMDVSSVFSVDVSEHSQGSTKKQATQDQIQTCWPLGSLQYLRPTIAYHIHVIIPLIIQVNLG